MSERFLTFRCGAYRFAIDSKQVIHVTDGVHRDIGPDHIADLPSQEADLNMLLKTDERSCASLFLRGDDGQVIRIGVTDIDGLEDLEPEAFVNLPLFNKLLSQLVAGVSSTDKNRILFRINPPALWLDDLREDS
jgi:hypothetical protein